LVFGTLRSGQKIEAPHSIILVGDANQGSEIISGGDVIVLGSLKGVAHAGAFDEDGGGRVIIALQLTPIQLRIGSVISRGEPSFVSVQKEPEIAFLQDGQIIVESFDPKKFKTFKF
jgi:septum site-determining protein MinC